MSTETTMTAAIDDNDRNRATMISDNDRKKEQTKKNDSKYRRQGDTQVAGNKMEKESEKEGFQTMAYSGEQVRKENEILVESKIHDEQIRDKDLRKAADQSILNSAMVIENEKTNGTTAGVGPGENGLSQGARTSAKMKNRDMWDGALSGSDG